MYPRGVLGMSVMGLVDEETEAAMAAVEAAAEQRGHAVGSWYRREEWVLANLVHPLSATGLDCATRVRAVAHGWPLARRVLRGGGVVEGRDSRKLGALRPNLAAML